MKDVVLDLHLVAGLAEKLAKDIEQNKLWEGDFQQRLNEIKRHMQDLERFAAMDRRY